MYLAKVYVNFRLQLYMAVALQEQENALVYARGLLFY